jgi:hypothetical protein
MWKKFLLFLIIGSVSFSYSKPQEEFRRVKIIIRNIYTLDQTTFGGTIKCKVYCDQRITRQDWCTTYGPYNWEKWVLLELDDKNNDTKLTSYKPYYTTYPEIVDGIHYTTTEENLWHYDVNFSGNENYDVVSASKLSSSFINEGNGYHTHVWEYDIYVVKKTSEYQLGMQEIEVSENVINKILEDNIYTEFPKSIDGTQYLIELGTPEIDLRSNSDNGYIHLTAPIKVAYQGEIDGTCTIDFSPVVLPIPWIPEEFGTYFAYSIIFHNLDISVDDILIGGLTVPPYVIDALKAEIKNLDLPIPVYPKVIFNTDIPLDDLNIYFVVEYTIPAPKILYDRMIFKIYGQYDKYPQN